MKTLKLVALVISLILNLFLIYKLTVLNEAFIECDKLLKKSIKEVIEVEEKMNVRIDQLEKSNFKKDSIIQILSMPK